MSAFLRRVSHDHRPLRHPFGARGPDVVLAEHVEHGAPREPRDDRDRGGGQGERGEHQVGEEVAGTAAAVGREHAGGGEPPEPEREDHHQHDAEPEDRHAGAEERRHRAQPIEQRVGARRGADAEGDAADGGEEQRARGQEQRGLEPLHHLGQHRTLHPERAAEIALEDAADPVQILDVERPVEAELGAQAREIFLRGLRSEHHLRRVSRREVQDEEHDQRDAQQDRPQVQEPAQKITAHADATAVCPGRSTG